MKNKYMCASFAKAALAAGAVGIALQSGQAMADDLFLADGSSALVSDQRARNVGDLVTVVIYEQSSVVSSAQSGTRKNNSLSGGLSAGSVNESGSLGFGGDYSGRAESGRSGRMVAQISVTVDRILPNGDFLISGIQKMHINGEVTDIGIRGRVRQADLTSDNRILSSRIADAQIDYKGKGFVSRGAKPGILTRIFSFLGLM